MEACLPISRGTFPSIADAEVSGSAWFTKRWSWHVTAAALFMRHLPRPARNMNSFPGNKLIHSHARLRRIKSVAPLSMTNTARSTDAQQAFEAVTNYTVVEGYTLNGQLDGPTTFAITCQARGTFK